MGPNATAPFALGAPGAPQQRSVRLSNTAAGASGVTYAVHFTTTSRGGLAGAWGRITINAPAGTTFSSDGCQYTVINLTQGRSSNCKFVSVLDEGATAQITVGPDIGNLEDAVVRIAGVTNAPSAGPQTLSLFTTSDSVASPVPFTLT